MRHLAYEVRRANVIDGMIRSLHKDDPNYNTQLVLLTLKELFA